MKGSRICETHILWCALLIVALISSSSPYASADVVLNGYQFSDDSDDLSKNRYFSNYSRGVDFHYEVYGYGNFKGYDVRQVFSQYYAVDGIKCIVVLEHGYFPQFSLEDGITSFDMIPYSGYLFYAKDINNNIHLLNGDVSQGGTTLLYPDTPEEGQKVYGGLVVDTAYELGDVSNNVLVIRFDSLPYTGIGPALQYVLPGSGVFAISYNWDGGVNGFSLNRKPPESMDKESSAWEEWRDDHCFISACGH